jgi:opacity protein-like surface antigen
MKIKLTLLAAAVALAPMSAMAGGSVDVFYIFNEADIGTAQDPDGDGIGVRAEAELSKNLSFTGLHQSSDLDVSGTDSSLRETRIGLKYSHALEGIMLTGEIEHVNTTLRVEGVGSGGDDGYAIKVGGQMKLTDQINAYAKVGYIDLHSTGDGVEYDVGAAVKLNDQVSGFLEYRYVDISESGSDLELSTIRVGARYHF